MKPEIREDPMRFLRKESTDGDMRTKIKTALREIQAQYGESYTLKTKEIKAGLTERGLNYRTALVYFMDTENLRRLAKEKIE